jgi:hypothetical protein
MLASATPSVESCFTLSGWNSGLGAIRFGSARICAFGPQMGSQGDSQFFGLAQFPLNVGAPCDGRLEGWTRCFGAREVWLHLNARVDTERVVFGVRFLGIGSGNTVRMVFYVDADSCTLEDGTVLRPGNLQRARQKGLSILFNESVQFACSESFEMEIIPLAGQGCYWDSSFLVSFEFNSFLDRCVYSVCFV